MQVLSFTQTRNVMVRQVSWKHFDRPIHRDQLKRV